MRGLSLIGLLVTLAVLGVLVFNQLKPSATEKGTSAPTEAIDKANKARETVENQTNKLPQDLNQP